MAPEIANNQHAKEKKEYRADLSDIFSFGVIMFEIMVGSLNRDLVMISSGGMPELHADKRAQYPEVVPIYEQCVNKDPLLRPSAAKIEEDLQ